MISGISLFDINLVVVFATFSARSLIFRFLN